VKKYIILKRLAIQNPLRRLIIILVLITHIIDTPLIVLTFLFRQLYPCSVVADSSLVAVAERLAYHGADIISPITNLGTNVPVSLIGSVAFQDAIRAGTHTNVLHIHPYSAPWMTMMVVYG
jgi:hypothetical protein